MYDDNFFLIYTLIFRHVPENASYFRNKFYLLEQIFKGGIPKCEDCEGIVKPGEFSLF